MSTSLHDERISIESKSQIGKIYQIAFSKLYNNALFSDIKLEFGSKSLYGHKVVLSLSSPVIRSRITNNSTTYKFAETEKFIDMFISFIYLGQVESLSEEDCIALLEIASTYQCEHLKSACGNFLADRSSADNLGFLITIAEKFDCETLKNRCGKFVAENFSSMLKSNALMDLHPQIWKGILMSTKVKVDSEQQLLEAVLKYCEQRKDEETLKLLVPFIHFTALEPEYLVTVLEPKYRDNPIFHDKLYAAFKAFATHSPVTEEREYDGPAWTWVANPPISITNRGKTVQNMNTGNRSAIGSKPLSQISPRQWSIRIDKLESGGWVGLGIAPENAKTLSFSGAEQMWMCSANSYAWPAQRMEGFTFAPSDIITISLNSSGELQFKKNGQSTGKVLSGFGDLRQPLYKELK